MLCSHPDAACLRFFEALNPVQDPSRYLAAQVGLAIQAWMRPWLTSMFPLEADIPFEEVFLTGNLFSSWQYAFDFASEKYRAWYLEREHDIAYEYVRSVYQLIDYQREQNNLGTTHKVRILKSPQHMPNVGSIRRVFPGAKMVVTTRGDHVKVLESFLTIMTYGHGAAFTNYDLEAYGKEMLATLEQGIGRFNLFGQSGDSNNVLHTTFEALCQNATAVGERVIAAVGLDPVPPSVISKGLRPCRGANKMSYHLNAFGLTPEDVQKAFSK
jgi:hypothetical protein